MDGYRRLHAIHCYDRDGRPKADFAEDIARLLKPLLLRLPNFRHIETAKVSGEHPSPCRPWAMQTDSSFVRHRRLSTASRSSECPKSSLAALESLILV